MANRSQTKRSISAHTPTVWHFACVQIVAIYLMIALHRAAPTVLPLHPASPSAGEGRGPHFLLHCPPPVSCGTSPGQWPRGRLHPAVEGWPLRTTYLQAAHCRKDDTWHAHNRCLRTLLQHRCAAVSCTEFQGKVRRMKSIFGTIKCGIIITINNNSVSGDVGFVEKLTKYRFFFLRFEIRLLHLVEKKCLVADCTVEFEWNVYRKWLRKDGGLSSAIPAAGKSGKSRK